MTQFITKQSTTVINSIIVFIVRNLYPMIRKGYYFFFDSALANHSQGHKAMIRYKNLHPSALHIPLGLRFRGI